MKALNNLTMAVLSAALLWSCATPTNIAYFQDMEESQVLQNQKVTPIRLKPMDQVSIIVNTRVPEVTAMFNMPYYTNRIGETQSLTSASGTNYSLSATNISGYTLDADGNIDFPVLGKINLAGKTREEAANYIKDLIIASKQTKEAVVTVEFMNLGFSVLGEVTRPGRYKIDRDRFTIFDALGLAGDLTINGQRENVTLVRHNGQADEVFKLNLLDAGQLYSSPAFYVQQGDMIYVLPNEKRVRESTVNGNTVRSSSFWISLASLTTSVIVLMSNLSSHSSSK
ncbi:MAG: polysaccharide biosynthesis/export family protein [Bacteroidales bacterium]|nr:polysaccharide biosynthesis/export family protein [Bacteroidales bacterium]